MIHWSRGLGISSFFNTVALILRDTFQWLESTWFVRRLLQCPAINQVSQVTQTLAG